MVFLVSKPYAIHIPISDTILYNPPGIRIKFKLAQVLWPLRLVDSVQLA